MFDRLLMMIFGQICRFLPVYALFAHLPRIPETPFLAPRCIFGFVIFRIMNPQACRRSFIIKLTKEHFYPYVTNSNYIDLSET